MTPVCRPGGGCYVNGRVMRLFAGLLLFFLAACDTSVRVGELETEAPPPAPAPPPPAVTPTWGAHPGTIPCNIHAMAEARSDQVYVGCRGGRLYRFDGVGSQLVLGDDEKSVFSLVWASRTGDAIAAAQIGTGPSATTKLFRQDGQTFHPFAAPPKRVVSLAGVDAASLWVATDDAIFRAGESSPAYTSTNGTFRACAFAAPDKGWCVGTNGLVVTWNGQTWTATSGAPWTAAAEVFGVEVEPFSKQPIFFYGEPIAHANGDWSCRVARLKDQTFATLSASTPCFASFDVARKRTGSVVVNGRTYMMLSPSDQYGGALLFDITLDAVKRMCGPILAFSSGLSSTRAGGLYGLLATVVGTGDGQVALDSVGASNMELGDLSVAPDGTAWSRAEDVTVCGSVSDRLLRFEDATWRPVAGPQAALGGRGLAAISRDQAYTIGLASSTILEFAGGEWLEGPELPDAWTLFAKKPREVWVGGYKDGFGRYDGTTFQQVMPPGRGRQVLQILTAGSDVWTVTLGYTQADTDAHLLRWSNGSIREWDLGLVGSNIRISALDETHVWRSGNPAHVWNGTEWKRLPFDATGVWARAENEIYFTKGGDIFRWDGATSERVYHGLVTIREIAGTADRAFAVGPGGLTLEFKAWPPSPAR